MGKRFTDTCLYDKEWFMDLSLKHKCLWEYIRLKCDNAGIWDVSLRLASCQIGEKIEMSDLDIFKDRLEWLSKDKILIIDFIPFQYGILSRKSNPHQSVIKKLEKNEISHMYEILDVDTSHPSANAMRKRVGKKTRERIFFRDNMECQYCRSRDSLVIDHIIPLAKGGNNDDDNLITSCPICNSKKSDLLLTEWVEKIKDNNVLNNVNNILNGVNNKLLTLEEEEEEEEEEQLKYKEKEKEDNSKRINESKLIDLWNKNFPDHLFKGNFLGRGTTFDHFFISSGFLIKYEDWQEVFDICKKSSWLLKEFKSFSFMWVLNWDNILKIKAGNYTDDDKPKKPPVDEIMTALQSPTYAGVKEILGENIIYIEKMGDWSYVKKLTEFEIKRIYHGIKL